MKCLILCGLVLTLGLCCRAEEETDGDCQIKMIEEFHKDIATGLCKPAETDSAKLKALTDCKSHIGDDEEVKKRMEIFESLGKTIYETCGTPNEADIKEYTKVELNEENKIILMSYCSEKFMTCAKDELQKKKEEWKAKKESGEVKGHNVGKKLSDDQKKQIQQCMHSAVYGQS